MQYGERLRRREQHTSSRRPARHHSPPYRTAAAALTGSPASVTSSTKLPHPALREDSMPSLTSPMPLQRHPSRMGAPRSPAGPRASARRPRSAAAATGRQPSRPKRKAAKKRMRPKSASAAAAPRLAQPRAKTSGSADPRRHGPADLRSSARGRGGPTSSAEQQAAVQPEPAPHPWLSALPAELQQHLKQVYEAAWASRGHACVTAQSQPAHTHVQPTLAGHQQAPPAAAQPECRDAVSITARQPASGNDHRVLIQRSVVATTAAVEVERRAHTARDAARPPAAALAVRNTGMGLCDGRRVGGAAAPRTCAEHLTAADAAACSGVESGSAGGDGSARHASPAAAANWGSPVRVPTAPQAAAPGALAPGPNSQPQDQRPTAHASRESAPLPTHEHSTSSQGSLRAEETRACWQLSNSPPEAALRSSAAQLATSPQAARTASHTAGSSERPGFVRSPSDDGHGHGVAPASTASEALTARHAPVRAMHERSTPTGGSSARRGGGGVQMRMQLYEVSQQLSQAQTHRQRSLGTDASVATGPESISLRLRHRACAADARHAHSNAAPPAPPPDPFRAVAMAAAHQNVPKPVAHPPCWATALSRAYRQAASAASNQRQQPPQLPPSTEVTSAAVMALRAAPPADPPAVQGGGGARHALSSHIDAAAQATSTGHSPLRTDAAAQVPSARHSDASEGASLPARSLPCMAAPSPHRTSSAATSMLFARQNEEDSCEAGATQSLVLDPPRLSTTAPMPVEAPRHTAAELQRAMMQQIDRLDTMQVWCPLCTRTSLEPPLLAACVHKSIACDQSRFACGYS